MALTFVHVNDLHGHYDLYAQAASLARARGAMLVDAGDAFEATSLRCSATRGEVAARLWRAAGVAAVTVGNAEILNYGIANLERVAALSQVPVLAANLLLKDGGYVPGTQPWTIAEHGRHRVAILGLTAPLEVYSRLGIRVLDPSTVVAEHLPYLRSQANVVVVLSHLGLWDDKDLSKIPGIDVIVGGHSHHRLEKPRRVGGSPIVQASKQGGWIGEVTLDGGRVVGRLHASAGVLAAPDVAAELSRIDSEVEAWSCTAVATFPRPHARDQLGRVIVDLLKKTTESDGAVLLEGLVVDGLPKGTVDRSHLHRALPFAVKPAVTYLKGGELLKFLERAHDPSRQKRRLDMLRGERVGGIHKAGIEVHLVPKGRNQRIRRVIVEGRPLQLRNTYRIATSDLETTRLAGLASTHLPSRVDTDTLLLDVLERAMNGELAPLHAPLHSQ